uniref:Uncharacterized protein n=1 Tax=Brassica oleracea TaxID=3712 RepID=A0A3P6DBR2_BRAOL|nr:unnamed protein product [Brassica oleracea]
MGEGTSHVPGLVPSDSAPACGRKRRWTRGNDGESSQQEGLSLASGFRVKFVSLIDGMISECGSEVSRLARDRTEMQGKLSESEAMLKAIKDSHSAKVSKLEVQIGEPERDLGKTASSLLKEKKARKTKSLEVRRLQHRIESGEGSTNHGVEEAKDALRVEFQTRLAKISDFLGPGDCRWLGWLWFRHSRVKPLRPYRLRKPGCLLAREIWRPWTGVSTLSLLT